MQLVVSGNRVLAHGEDCFLAMGGTVVCTVTGRTFQHATVVTCEGCPSDIDRVPYEYHAGQFVPGVKGIPAGGTAGQVLVKASDADYDIRWAEISGEALLDGDEVSY